jgi:hypothetical protein
MDKFITSRELQGEGVWSIAHIFEDDDGKFYEVWQDRDGEEKIVELDRD